jgi:hypothetical protein
LFGLLEARDLAPGSMNATRSPWWSNKLQPIVATTRIFLAVGEVDDRK